jgi:hypothetical protein
MNTDSVLYLFLEYTRPPVSEGDEKDNTTEDEKTTAGVTTTEYSRRT